MRLKGSTHVSFGKGSEEKFGDILAKKKVTLSWLLNSNMVKPEKFDHLDLVYYFTVHLNLNINNIGQVSFDKKIKYILYCYITVTFAKMTQCLIIIVNTISVITSDL